MIFLRLLVSAGSSWRWSCIRVFGCYYNYFFCRPQATNTASKAITVLKPMSFVSPLEMWKILATSIKTIIPYAAIIVNRGCTFSNVGNTIPIPPNKSAMPVSRTRFTWAFTQGNGSFSGCTIFIKPAQIKVAAKSTWTIHSITFLVLDVFCFVDITVFLVRANVLIFAIQMILLSVWIALSE